MTTHKTGYNVYLYGERFWHRSLDAAIARARNARYCSNPQVVEISSGALMYGRPE